jgi:cell shape-determining protein MreC
MKLGRSRNRRDEGVIVTEISSYSITGFVARIVTDDDLIINKGRADGVVEGMIFDILDTRTRDIKRLMQNPRNN